AFSRAEPPRIRRAPLLAPDGRVRTSTMPRRRQFVKGRRQDYRQKRYQEMKTAGRPVGTFPPGSRVLCRSRAGGATRRQIALGWPMVEWALELIRQNALVAYAVIAIVCFAESLAFVSLLFPGWLVMVGAGALVQSGTLQFLPVCVAATAGAVLGDAVSYWV